MNLVHYWLDEQDAPFRTLLCVVGTYCHPEAGPDAYGDLIRLARTRPDDEEMRQFKDELRQVLTGDTEGLHPDAVFTAACYNDGTDQAFLGRLWRHLYPGEPAPRPFCRACGGIVTASPRELRRLRTFYVGEPGSGDLRAACVIDGRDYTDPDQVRADVGAAVDELHRRQLAAQLFTEPVNGESPRPDLPTWQDWAHRHPRE